MNSPSLKAARLRCRFKRAQFTITAVLPAVQKSSGAALADVRSLEGKLLEKQAAVRAFERDYRQARRPQQRLPDALSSVLTAGLLASSCHHDARQPRAHPAPSLPSCWLGLRRMQQLRRCAAVEECRRRSSGRRHASSSLR